MSFSSIPQAGNNGNAPSFLRYANYASSALVLAAPLGSLLLKRFPVFSLGCYAATQLMNYQWNTVNSSSVPDFSSLRN